MNENNFRVRVASSIMGSGKTSGMINMIRQSSDEQPWIVITPYITEVERYIKECNVDMNGDPNNKKFVQPKDNICENGKTGHLRKLIKAGKNIITTHALFDNFDSNIVELCKLQGYNLVMDEVHEVIQPAKLDKPCREALFERFATIEKDTGIVRWRDDAPLSKHSFKELHKLKSYCDTESLVCYGENNLMVWLFPVKIFSCFKDIFILTYLYEGQVQSSYFKYHNVEYTYMDVKKDSDDNFILVDSDGSPSDKKGNYKQLINLIENDKLNNIGETPFKDLDGNSHKPLTSSWYKSQKNILSNENPDISSQCMFDILRKNLITFFKTRCKSQCVSDRLWTCYQHSESCGVSKIVSSIEDKGFKSKRDKKDRSKFTKNSAFIPMNIRATNDYADRTNLAYLIDVNLDPSIANFFSNNGITVDRDRYSLSEMLQWIWRGAIRNGEPINLYVPSKRMRNLLKDWIDENSL